MLFLGLDLGTSGVKAVVYDGQGEVVSLTYLEYQFVLDSKARELDSENIWACTKEVIRKIDARVKKEVAGIAVSSFGEAFVCIDREGKPLLPIVVANDTRADELFASYNKTLDMEYVAGHFGVSPSPTYSAAKMLYIKTYIPEVYDKTDVFLMVGDYINFRLSGERRSEHSTASRTMLFDVHRRGWDLEFIEKTGLDARKFARPVCSGEIIGTILPELDDDLGLSCGTKIIAGGHDQPCCVLGGGNDSKTLVCSMGTSEAISCLLTEPLPAQTVLRYSFPCEPYLEKERYCTMLYNPAGGIMFKWFFDTFYKLDFQKGKPPYALFEENAPPGPTSLMVLPYPAGRGTPKLDNSEKMAIEGLDLGTDKFTLYKALIEGMCFEQRYNLELLRKTGQSFDRIVAVGGGTNSGLWLQLKADILKVPIHLLQCKEAASLGCAMICAVALGQYASLGEAAENMVRRIKTIVPNTEDSAAYEVRYQDFLERAAID